MGGWVGGWMDGWMEVKAVLRIAYNNQKFCGSKLRFTKVKTFANLVYKRHFYNENIF
jgi:hypothetical protein